MIKNSSKKILGLFLAVQLLAVPSAFSESPWVKNDSVFEKMTGKLGYGLKNSLLGWTSMFIEAAQPEYKTEWNGFCVGIARGIFYTGSGLIQLATFPIPVDFPDLGPGLHLPQPRDNYAQTIGVNKGVPNSAPVTKPSNEEITEVKIQEPVSAPEPPAVPDEKKIEAIAYEVPPPQPVLEKETGEPTQKLDQLEEDLNKLMADEKPSEPFSEPSVPEPTSEELATAREQLAQMAEEETADSGTEEDSLENSLFAEDDAAMLKEMDAELAKSLQKSKPSPKKFDSEISDYTAV